MISAKALAIIVLLILLEIGNGIFRMKFLLPRFKNHRSRQIGVLSGCTIIFIVSLLSIKWIGVTNPSEALQVGLLWIFVMLLFEILFGKLFFRMPWKKIFDDFNIAKGNLLLIGMIFLLFAPFLAGKFWKIF